MCSQTFMVDTDKVLALPMVACSTACGHFSRQIMPTRLFARDP